MTVRDFELGRVLYFFNIKNSRAFKGVNSSGNTAKQTIILQLDQSSSISQFPPIQQAFTLPKSLPRLPQMGRVALKVTVAIPGEKEDMGHWHESTTVDDP
jgi:hypothetical protein